MLTDARGLGSSRVLPLLTGSRGELAWEINFRGVRQEPCRGLGRGDRAGAGGPSPPGSDSRRVSRWADSDGAGGWTGGWRII